MDNNNKLQPWIQFTRFFESISCITRLSARYFKNNDTLNKGLRDFYVSVIDIDNAFTRACYCIRNGEDLNLNLNNFNVPAVNTTSLHNTEDLKKLFSETIVKTKKPLIGILNYVPESNNNKFNYLEKPIKNFLSSVENINDIL